MLCCNWQVFNSCDWCILILAIITLYAAVNNNNPYLSTVRKTGNYNNTNNSFNSFTLFPALSLESTNLAVDGEEEKQIRQH